MTAADDRLAALGQDVIRARKALQKALDGVTSFKEAVRQAEVAYEMQRNSIVAGVPTVDDLKKMAEGKA